MDMAAVIEELDIRTFQDQPRLPERYEIVNGEIVELHPMSDYAGQVTNRLHRTITRYLIANAVGETSVELLYRIP